MEELISKWDEKVKYALKVNDDLAASEFLKEDYPLLRNKLEQLMQDNEELRKIVTEYINDDH